MQYDTSYDVLEAMSVYGFDQYINASRDWQILMVAHLKAKGTLRAMSEWESWHKNDK